MTSDQLELSVRLREYLQQSPFSEHARLPPERELAEKLGVTRNQLRGVLRRMAAQGEIWRHVGKGTFIGRRPFEAPQDDGNTGAGMVLTNPREVIDARLYFEPLLARLAVFNATIADQQEMQLCLDKMSSAPGWPAWASWDGRLHRAIAKASGNALLVAMFDTLQACRNREVFRTLERPFKGMGMASRDHAAVVKAICERDAVRAEASMRKHILALRNAVFGD
ncbi:MAG: FadR/GntR family transcriptional regulator [Lautropia sp.]